MYFHTFVAFKHCIPNLFILIKLQISEYYKVFDKESHSMKIITKTWNLFQKYSFIYPSKPDEEMIIKIQKKRLNKK